MAYDAKSKELSAKALQIAYSIGNLYKLEKICKHKDGHTVAVDLSLDLLPDKKTFVVVVNSLEDQKRLEDLNKNLEMRINQEIEKNTRQLESIQKEQLKSAKLTSIGSLAAGVTHEINTPLTYIKGNFEMMLQEINYMQESESKQYLLDDSVKVLDGIKRIENIVESMREVSKISGENKSVVNVYETLVTSLMISHNRAKHISKVYINGELFDIDFDKNKFSFEVMGQKQRLEQVWMVIINNALDELVKIDNFDDRDLFISIFNENHKVIVRFKDNAGGIPEETLPNIFDPFVSTKEHCGVGIGLNIAYNIIQDNNGKITAYNEENGAVFEIELDCL